MARWALVLLVACGCVESGKSQSQPQPQPQPSSPLCAICSSDDECGSGVCKQYGDGNRKCSRACTPWEPASQCTAPASGACNGMGFCMCPYVEPPHDGGADGPPPIDAAGPIEPTDAATFER